MIQWRRKMFLSRGADIDVRQVKFTHTCIPHALDFAHCSIYVYINCGLLTKMHSNYNVQSQNNITMTISQTVL